MVICKPEDVGASRWWSDLRGDTDNHVVLQEQSVKTPFTHSFRILILHGSKHYRVATAGTLDEINRDWDYIQGIIHSKVDRETEPTVDPTLALISLVYNSWKKSRSRSHSTSNPDDIVIQRTGSFASPSSPIHPPPAHHQLPHSNSEPVLSNIDRPNPPITTHTPNRDSFHPAHTPSNTPTSNPASYSNHSPIDQLAPLRERQHSPLRERQSSLSEAKPPSLSPTITRSNHSHPETPPSHPNRTPSHPTQPPSQLPPNYPASPTFPPTPTSNTSPKLPPPPTVLLEPISPPPPPPVHTPAHATSVTSPQLDIKPETKPKNNTALDSAVVAEIMAWEQRRSNLTTKLDVLMKKKTLSIQGIVNDYLEAMREIVVSEKGLSDNMRMNMITQEYLRLESMKDSMFSAKSCAIIACVDAEIKSAERTVKLKSSVIKLQALTRGYLIRKKYKPQIKARRHRNKCVLELLETEQTYVRMLELLVKVFLVPLKESSLSKTPLIRKEDAAILFSNIESVLGMNKELLTSLEERISTWSPKSLIGDILIKMAPYMRLYTQYVNTYNDSLNILNRYSKFPDFVEFLTKAKANPELKSMDIASFLILPVQRIPRYVLLLQEIVKVTPTTHPDYANLQKALELIQEVARAINESKRQAENTSKVMTIQASVIFGTDKHFEDLVQPHRKFKKEGALTRDVDSTIEDCYLFLFSDLLLITQKRKGFLDGSFHYIYLESLKFVNATVRSIPDTRIWQHGFSVTAFSKNERFFADTAQNKNEWMNAIAEVIDSVKKNRQTLKVDLEEIAAHNKAEQEHPTSNPPPTNPPPSPTAPQTSQITPAQPQSQSQTPQYTLSSQPNRKSLALSNSMIQLLQQDPKISHSAPKLKQVVALYRQALQMEAEIFVLPYQIKTLLPSITVTPQNLQELLARITLISSRISEIDNVHDNVMYMIRDEKAVVNLDRLISQGMIHIDSMLKYLTATFPKEMVAPNAAHSPARASIRQSSSANLNLSLPYKLMSSILSWYLNITDHWASIMEKQM